MKKLSLMILLLVVALASCKKTPEVNLKYVDVERDLITVGTTTATVQCDYQYIATLKKAYLYYGEGEDEADMNTAEMRVVQNTLYVDLAGLKENTTYSYYYEFHNGFNSMRTVAKTFKTEGSGATITLPTVITAEVTEITTNSAKGGGEVTNDGGAEVTERGICWSTNANPTLSDNHIAAGAGIGVFTAMMNSLEANTTYHVRAYATNEKGTAYGFDREFVTVGGGGNDQEGALSGMFSVAPDRWVRFSKGNLQYQASTNTWRFAENQWDYVGDEIKGTVYENGEKCDNDLISSTYSGWIDLFGWGTSGYDNTANDPYAINYQPWSIIDEDVDTTYNKYGYGPSINQPDINLVGTSKNYDWGVYNAISNGGNVSGIWRTMSFQETNYMLGQREGAVNKRSIGTVHGVYGLILLPDVWNQPNGVNFVPNADNWETNVFTDSQWTLMENAGAAFLPASGYRIWNQVVSNYVQFKGEYWTTTRSGSTSWLAWHAIGHFVFDPGGCYGGSGAEQFYGRPVRLVQDDNPQPSIQTPTVITSDVSNVTSNSAICGGEVTSDGGAIVTERGICWSTNANPTISDSHAPAGTGIGMFSASMNGLQASTTYHVRAYATNEAGTAYGEDKEFTTLSGGGNEHEGALSGMFSVAEDRWVRFSKGNLQYQASTGIWRFAENQWDYVGTQHPNYGTPGGTVFGSDNFYISSTYIGWIDLFGWGTSGWNNGNVYYQPYDYEELSVWNAYDYGYGYGPTDGTSYRFNLTGTYANADWGIHNSIINGGNMPSQWRTLTIEEWNYLINSRTTSSGIRFAKGVVNGVNGFILLPDDWNSSVFTLNYINREDAVFATNVINASDWETIEFNGAVFLPAAGGRGKTIINYVGTHGEYWSTTYNNNDENCAGAYSVHFGEYDLNTYYGLYRAGGISVRLVQDDNP